MNKYISFSLAAIMGLGLAAIVLAQTPPPAPDKPVKLHVEIKNNGRVLVRGANITSIATTTINAATTWEGGASIPWIINTDGSTEYVRRHGGKGASSEFAVGHVISFSGWLVPGPALTVRADVVRNWSIEKVKINPFGVIQSINSAAKSFVLRSEERGDSTVFVSDATEILKQKATTTFEALRVGDRAHVKGLWDRVANTIQAEKIKVFVEDRRVFEDGRLKSFSATSTAPTNIVITFKKFDYTVNIDVDTAVVNNRWEPASLSTFKLGDHIRVYGVPDGNVIEATVVRNVSLKP